MLTVYNTMTRRKEEFRPLKEGEVSIYCCGVTPYNDPHIGNARPFVTWDVIRRYLARKGYRVRYIQNFTAQCAPCRGVPARLRDDGGHRPHD